MTQSLALENIINQTVPWLLEQYFIVEDSSSLVNKPASQKTCLCSHLMTSNLGGDKYRENWHLPLAAALLAKRGSSLFLYLAKPLA